MAARQLVESSRNPSISVNGRRHLRSAGNCCPVRAMMEKRHHNFQRTGPLARLMYYRGGSWVDFTNEVVQSLRPSFVQRRPVVDIAIDGSRYLFDFLRMLQTDFETGNQRSIAWIDDSGGCFFPGSFVEEVEETSVKRKREDRVEIEEEEGEEAEVSSSNDKRRCLVLSGNNPKKSLWPNARLLEEGEGSYLQMKDSFLSTMKRLYYGATVTAIHHCEWRDELGQARFGVFRKQAERTMAVRGTANIVYAWRGATKKNINSILAHGFSVPSDVNGSGSYGVGLYFSPMGMPNLSYMKSELDENGEMHVLLCRVILGNVEKVEFGSKQSHPSGVNFDTGVDDPRNPKSYVVWCCNMNTHVIPEFVVSFRPSSPVKGLAKGAGCVKRSIAELFSKIRNALPPTKAQELENLYSIFRAGRLAKDMFVKQLRSIAGDGVLISTIREIRGSGY